MGPRDVSFQTTLNSRVLRYTLWTLCRLPWPAIDGAKHWQKRLFLSSEQHVPKCRKASETKPIARQLWFGPFCCKATRYWPQRGIVTDCPGLISHTAGFWLCQCLGIRLACRGPKGSVAIPNISLCLAGRLHASGDRAVRCPSCEHVNGFARCVCTRRQPPRKANRTPRRHESQSDSATTSGTIRRELHCHFAPGASPKSSTDQSAASYAMASRR